MKKHCILAFVLGVMFILLFGFTRDWIESTPTDATVANQIDDFNRGLRVDVSDRIKSMLYGFTAGETEIGFKYMQIYEQASVSQPSAAYGRLYGKAVGGKCELHWQDEDADEIELTEGGKLVIGYGTASQAIMWNTTEEDGAGGRESQIRATGEQSGGERTTLGYDEFSHEGSSDDQKGQRRIFLNDGDDGDTPTLVMTIPSTGVAPTMVESTAPTTDAQLANKKYVDDSFSPTSMSGSEDDSGQVEFRNGLQMKWGLATSVGANSTKAVDFTDESLTDFSNACLQAFVTDNTFNQSEGPSVSAKSTTGLTVANGGASTSDIGWFAIGW